MRRIRLTAAALLVAVFMLGGVAGIGIAPLLRPDTPAPLPEGYADLQLTPEQVARGRAIIERHQGELDVILRELRPRAQAVHAQIRDEIDAILTPEQREKLRLLESVRGGPHTGERPPPPPWPPR